MTTFCRRLDRYDQNHDRTVSFSPKELCKQCSSISWSTVSNAADKSRRARAAMLPPSSANNMSDSRLAMTVSVRSASVYESNGYTYGCTYIGFHNQSNLSALTVSFPHLVVLVAAACCLRHVRNDD